MRMKFRVHWQVPLLLTALFAIHLFIFRNLIALDPVLKVDDAFLLDPLMKLKSVFDYSLKKSFDVQPVRDFLYLLQIGIKKAWNMPIFHLTNVLIWMGVTYLFYLIMRQLHGGASRGGLYFLTALFSLHPTFVYSVSWIAAQKHLLTAFFTLLNTFILVRYSRQGRALIMAFIMALVYSLAVLSQPITLLWPLWALFWVFINNEDRLKQEGARVARNLLLMALPMIILLLFIGYLNWDYYLEDSSSYAERFGRAKSLPFEATTVLMILAAWGRYMMNLIFPFHLAFNYPWNSPLNFAGLLLFIFWIILAVRRLPRKTWLPWILFYFLHMAPVTFNMTRNFVSDSYVLTSAVAFFHLSYCLANRLVKGHGYTRPVKIAAFILLLVFVQRGRQVATVWERETSLFASSYQEWPAHYLNIYYLIQYKLDDKKREKNIADFKEIQRLIVELSNADHEILLKLVAIKRFSEHYYQSIYEHTSMSPGNKMDLIRFHNFESSLKNYFLAELALQSGENELSLAHAEKVLQAFAHERKVPVTVQYERALALYEFNAGIISERWRQDNRQFERIDYPRLLGKEYRKEVLSKELEELRDLWASMKSGNPQK